MRTSFFKHIIQTGADKAASPKEARKVILCNQFIIAAAVMHVTYLAAYLYYGLWVATAEPIVFIALSLIVLYLNKQGYHLTAKTMMMCMGNGAVYYAACVFNRQIPSTQHLLVAVMVCAFWVMSNNPKERLILWASTALSFTLFFMIEVHYIYEPLSMLVPLSKGAIEFMRFMVPLSTFGLIIVGIVYFQRDMERAETMLKREHDRADNLLLNIMPKPIADRLKSGETTIADQYDNVTVLFADIVGFTQLSTFIGASKVVWVLDEVFSTFDEIAERYHLEKIKTIGDAYMVVAGLPEARADHTEAIAMAALDMQVAVKDIAERIGTRNFSVRIGIQTGTVVAGIIGTKKFAYDLWGDTVNTAARMESHGVENKIHCTEEVYKVLYSTFGFEPRGSITVKGKGEMQTYFLTSRNDSGNGAYHGFGNTSSPNKWSWHDIVQPSPNLIELPFDRFVTEQILNDATKYRYEQAA
jgi:class 3 adenylate cyclase